MLGSLGFTEIAFILVLALLLFGPKRLPEIGRTLGKGLAEFRRASNELKRTLESEVALDETSTRRPAAASALSPPKPSIASTPAATLPDVTKGDVAIQTAEQAPTASDGETAAPEESATQPPIAEPRQATD